MKKNTLLIAILLTCYLGFAQQLTWTGAVNNDFFTEQNWIDVSTNTAPADGTINWNVPINRDLEIQSSSTNILANGVINLGSGSLTIQNSTISGNALSGGTFTIQNDGYIDLTNTDPLRSNVQIHFNSGIGWVKTLNLKGDAINTAHINQLKVNGQAGIYQSNLRLDNYYFNGTVIRNGNISTEALTIYDQTNLQGNSTNLSLDTVHSGAMIGNNLDNEAESFLLKKGHMVTFAVTEDGTGQSKNYIASETDLIINELPSYLQNDISFIRVIPWNWVSKKGIGGDVTGLDNDWFYRWNNNGEPTLDVEYAPMSWGANGANDQSDIELYKSKYKATHVMAFNESDNCNDQSGQFNNLCDTDVAVGFYENLMKTGLRLVSPSCRENAPFGWLKEFHDKANEQNIRIDVIGVHWYDWASNPENSPNANPQDVFNRFVTYLEDVHNLYGLPIWITEFNANPNRTTAVNYAFMQLALPYLETLDYIERYAWFEPFSGTGDYFDATGTNLTNVGSFYKNQNSTPAIPEATIEDDSNLDFYYATFGPPDNMIINGFFETGDLMGWTGTNIGTLTTSAVYAGNTSARILAGAGSLTQTVAVDPLKTYQLDFFTRWFVTPNTGAIDVKILDASNNVQIANTTMGTSTAWDLVTMNFSTPSGVTAIKILIEKPTGSPGWFIDNAIMRETGSVLSVHDVSAKRFKIYPNASDGRFTISASQPINTYAIYNMQGRLIQQSNVLQSNTVAVDISNSTSGLYILSVSDLNSNTHSEKIIIK